jgi:hypothetical protein
MTCVSCGIITQLYILIRRTNEITNVARNNAALKAFILFSRPPPRVRDEQRCNKGDRNSADECPLFYRRIMSSIIES